MKIFSDFVTVGREKPPQTAKTGPVTAVTEPVFAESAGYRVKVNGKDAELNRARVSACPYNR